MQCGIYVHEHFCGERHLGLEGEELVETALCGWESVVVATKVGDLAPSEVIPGRAGMINVVWEWKLGVATSEVPGEW
jgi:hypothetical protein